MWEWELFELVFASLAFVLATALGYRALVRPLGTSLFDVVFLSSGMFFGLGTWVAYYYGRFTLPYAEPILLFEAFCTIVLYLLGILCLRLVYENWRSKAQEVRLVPSLKEMTDCFRGVAVPAVIAAAVFLWFARVHRGFVHEIWFSGTDTDEAMAAIPYYWIVVYSLAFSVGYACFLWSSRAVWEAPAHSVRLLAGTLIALEFGWMFLCGRRWLLEWTMFVAVGYFASGRRINWRAVVIALLGLGVLTSFFFPLFLNIRHLYQAGYSADENAVLRFIDLLMQALTYERGEMATLVDENMAERPLIHRFICEIRDGQRSRPLMAGNALLYTFLWAIPSAFLVNKSEMLQTEQFIQYWYGMPLDDTSTTWPALGCADFGIGGGFLVGILVGLILMVTQWLAGYLRKESPFVTMCLLGGMLDLMFQVECDPTANWILFRNVFVVWLFAKIVTIVTSAGSQRPALQS